MEEQFQTNLFLLGLILIYYFETFFCDSLRNTKDLAKEAPEFSLFDKTPTFFKNCTEFGEEHGFFLPFKLILFLQIRLVNQCCMLGKVRKKH